MGLLNLAAQRSIWRGLDYYERKMVLSCESDEPGIYDGSVAGSGENVYTVHIDLNHPRRSFCTCPFAEGRRVICKHMIALYFTVNPDATEEYLIPYGFWLLEEEDDKDTYEYYEYSEKDYYDEIREYVMSLSLEELRDELYLALISLEEEENYGY